MEILYAFQAQLFVLLGEQFWQWKLNHLQNQL